MLVFIAGHTMTGFTGFQARKTHVYILVSDVSSKDMHARDIIHLPASYHKDHLQFLQEYSHPKVQSLVHQPNFAAKT